MTPRGSAVIFGGADVLSDGGFKRTKTETRCIDVASTLREADFRFDVPPRRVSFMHTAAESLYDAHHESTSKEDFSHLAELSRRRCCSSLLLTLAEPDFKIPLQFVTVRAAWQIDMRDRKNASGRDTRRRRSSARGGGGGGGGGGGIGGPNNDPVPPLRGIESRPETAHGAVGNKLKVTLAPSKR